MDVLEFGWRDAVVVVAMMAAAYLALLLLRLARMHRSTAVAPVAAMTAPASASDAPAVAPEEPAPGFDAKLTERMALDEEIRQLQREVADLRREVIELKAARHVSPLYSDAMVLARRGFDASGIADECGISVGEAELVLALSRGGANFEDEVDNGGSARTAEPYRQ